jgi:hypothetical protein
MTPSLSDLHQSASLIKSRKVNTHNLCDSLQSLPSILEIMPLPFSNLRPAQRKAVHFCHSIYQRLKSSQSGPYITANLMQVVPSTAINLLTMRIYWRVVAFSLILPPMVHHRFDIYKHAHCSLLFQPTKPADKKAYQPSYQVTTLK